MKTTLFWSMALVAGLCWIGCGDDDDDNDDGNDSYGPGYNDLDVDGDSDGDTDADSDSDTEGSLSATVAWEIGGAFTCDVSFKVDPVEPNVELHFDAIRVTVYGAEGDEEPFRQPVEIPCEDGDYAIHKLVEGSYFVELEALADYDGHRLPYYSGNAEISVPTEEPETPLEIPLEIGRGAVAVGWGFDKGGCQNAWNDVAEVVVTLEGTRVDLEPKTLACDTAEVAFEGLEWDQYSVAVEGYNAANELTHRGLLGASPTGDAGVDPEDGARLDVRPGSDIGADEAWVVLYPVETP